MSKKINVCTNVVIIILIINIIIIFINGSPLFEREFLDSYGDQTLYFDVSKNLLEFNIIKTPYTLGYPLFLAPFIIITSANDWKDIIYLLIPVQSLLLVPLTFYLMIKRTVNRNTILMLLLLLFYCIYIIMMNQLDPLIKYNILGLIPLSEPLAIFLLILSYYYFDKYIYDQKIELRNIFILSVLILSCIVVRNSMLILFVPIFCYFIFIKDIKNLITLISFLTVLYIPQIIYNYMAFHSLTLNGYVWWETINQEKNKLMIMQIYNIESTKSFSVQYFYQNILNLLYSWLLLSMIILFSKPYNRFMNITIRFVGYINIMFYLSYWWSGAGGLIDRFLMPSYFLYAYFIGRSDYLK